MNLDKNMIIKLVIHIDEQVSVISDKAEAHMLLFHGEAASSYFNGTVRNGGVDTQLQYKDQPKHLSARYILEGEDLEGMPCKLFIENNGLVDDKVMPFVTKPMILTDSKALKWLEEEPLVGYVTYEEGQLIIRICKEV